MDTHTRFALAAARRATVRRLAVGLLLATGLGIPTAVVAGKPRTKIVDVDCADGDSINKALQKNEYELIVNITGLCVEDVVVARDRVTLRGTDPARDGIQAATTSDPYGAALFVRGARRVNIENLQVTGGRYAGLLIENTRRSVNVTNCWLYGNEQAGLLVANGLAAGTDLSIMGNGVVGIAVSETGLLTCRRCTVMDNPGAGRGVGVIATVSSLVRLYDSRVDAGVPLSIRWNSFAEVTTSRLSGPVALEAVSGSHVSSRGSLLDGAVLAREAGRVELLRTTQLSNAASGNIASGGARLTVGSGSSLVGQTTLAELSYGSFQSGATVEALTCGAAATAVCSPGAQVYESNCAGCF